LPRGGRRQGAPGGTYGNRTDLQTGPRQQPITTIPGGQYGSGVAQQQLQHAMPMGSGVLPTPATPVGGPPAGGPPGTPPGIDLTQVGHQGTPPGGLPDLLRGTERPDEHVMAGNAMGPGPGPEALTPMAPPSPQMQVLAQLNNAGDDQLPPAARALKTLLSVTNANASAP
jgi:hypothetical protein